MECIRGWAVGAPRTTALRARRQGCAPGQHGDSGGGRKRTLSVDMSAELAGLACNRVYAGGGGVELCRACFSCGRRAKRNDRRSYVSYACKEERDGSSMRITAVHHLGRESCEKHGEADGPRAGSVSQVPHLAAGTGVKREKRKRPVLRPWGGGDTSLRRNDKMFSTRMDRERSTIFPFVCCSPDPFAPL